MKITVFGSGYVGLVSSACLSQAGHEVLCIDIDQARVADLSRGINPIYEPGLDELLKSGLADGSLKFTHHTQDAVEHGEVLFIAVGTPPDEDGSADVRHVINVARSIGRHLRKDSIIVNKSTVPVGTAEQVQSAICEELAFRDIRLEFDVVSNPEFLKEGAAIEDFMKPDRIVIGTHKESSAELMRRLYSAFNRNHDRVMVMATRSAELTKYAANAMLATKISFMNEMANIAERVGADIEQVRQGIGSDPRIGYHFIYPGCGYGGSCFPKDVKALAATAQQYGQSSSLLNAVETINQNQKQWMFQRLNEHFSGELAGKTIALWGLAFKPRTDDMREAPALDLMSALFEAGARVQAYDPQAMDECQRIWGERDDLLLSGTKEMALKNADALVICTEWKNFWSPNFSQLKNLLNDALIIDGRNLYDPGAMAEEGFHYYSVGRPSFEPQRIAPVLSVAS
ncbi:UDP-glucose dehydrogenase family protein [Pseudoteredinibacter isoporae]|uniref:UDP-glucose 6-dehydrogenase n=1 Tax=Pseudoteredinibacter isoporae TaxID=570281 RepID=A0A7X0MWP3_9GAMM|nr:UDP-glucose/GDP-mannose dehydrogenase family protein [Pseudoteredinibacter isoporae]MBB6521164.1 UDPglucose 6-dehydrogenase [Pseudoteredinibacter isoporae]NHO86724.1 UDP-glucose/GDP-mannose dehydrogenase family protein [Pseudoteredinibacter isoporae]NIB24824.1 UDP-glucose/GDP-mannose dehydrogenase family protein [Pseudoteredinibacter isoporae]